MKIKFPRHYYDEVDEGVDINEGIDKNPCIKCNGKVVESVSAEYCSECMEIIFDYWPGAESELRS
jgi:hypothetical protein